MITLLLSFILSLASPTPIGRDTGPAVVDERPAALEQETEVASGSLLHNPINGVFNPDEGFNLRFAGDASASGAGDGWDRVRRLLANQVPGCSSGPETAEREP
jgi:hypothetical protein